MAVCPRCGRESPDSSRFCPGCGATLGKVRTPHEVRKVVTILFADVIESTPLGERLDPEALRRLLSRYFERMQAIIERHEGRVEKFVGDAIMAVFGIPVAHEDDALRALRAAQEMRTALALLNAETERAQGVRLEVRTGVNTGEVVTGDDAAASLVTGDAVNVAARLEQAAAPGQILLGLETHRLVAGAVLTTGAEHLDVKGKSRPITAFALDRVIADVAVPARRLDVPLLGREAELGALHVALDRAIAERSCCLFTILGAAGVGKSRLAAELAIAAGERATVLVGHAPPYGEGITYWPVIEALRQAAGIEEDDGADSAFDRFVELSDGDEEEAIAAATQVAALFGAQDASTTSWETFWALRRLFEGIARRRPLVLVLEDLHWAEPTLLEFLEYLADWSRDTALLILCLVRPEFLEERPSWAGRLHAENTLSLEPLQDDSANELIEILLAGASLTSAARSRIAAAAEGNPLFLEQMLAMIAEEQVVPDELAVPPTIRALLTARLDRLSDDERAVLERAAIIGRAFSLESVRELSSEPDAFFVDQQLMALARKELVMRQADAGSSEHRFRFKHALIREEAYAAMPKEMRADLHERFAERLERQSLEHEEIVGYHLEQASRCHAELGHLDDRGLGARAARRLARAGRRAFVRGDMPAAANLLGRAAALYPAGQGERLQLLPLLGTAFRETGDLSLADEVLTEALEMARESGDRRVESLAAMERASLRDYTDPSSDLDEVRRVAEHGLDVFEELGDEDGLAHAASLLAEVHWSRAHYAEMESVLERALVHAERAGDERLRAFLLHGIARAALLGPIPADLALRRCEEISARARGDPVLGAAVLPPTAGLYALRGEFEHARSLYRQARASFEEFGLRTALAALPLYSGPVELLAGDARAAERELRGGCRILEEIGDRSRLSTALAFLAQALYAQDRRDEANDAAEAAAGAATPHDAYTHVVSRAVRARVLAGVGDHGEAERLSAAAASLAADTDSTNLAADAELAFAEVLVAQGRHEAASEHARRALALYRAKGNTVSSERAQGLAGLDPRSSRA